MRRNDSSNHIRKGERRWGRIVLILAAVMILLACLAAMSLTSRVTVKYHTLDGNHTRSYLTGALDVAEFRADNPKDIAEKDIIGNPSDERVSDGMKIEVWKAEKGKAEIRGKSEDFWFYPGTVAENLTYNGIKFTADDIISPAKTAEVSAETQIRYDQVTYKYRDRKKDVKAEREVKLDPKLTSGVIEKTEGHPGRAVFRYTTRYVNGKKKETTVRRLRWITEPAKASMRFGTSGTGESGSVEWTRTFTGNTTAYYMGQNPMGASGMRCHFGTCAVDPSVIPYGTKLYVTGYGTAIATDCGSAVKGNVVDLYMHNNAEALRWGRRFVTVYVLDND